MRQYKVTYTWKKSLFSNKTRVILMEANSYEEAANLAKAKKKEVAHQERILEMLITTERIDDEGPISAQAVSGDKRFCTRCGSGLSPEAVFCPKCGTKQ